MTFSIVTGNYGDQIPLIFLTFIFDMITSQIDKN